MEKLRERFIMNLEQQKAQEISKELALKSLEQVAKKNNMTSRDLVEFILINSTRPSVRKRK